MGFESSRIARRRLASLAIRNDRVHEALSPSSFPGLFDEESALADAAPNGASGADDTMSALTHQLDLLAHDIVATPGAGGALLAAYAAQARALTMVIEAARRSEGNVLPQSVLLAAQEALNAPPALAGLSL